MAHDFSPNWHAVAGDLAQRHDRFIDTPVNVLIANPGNPTSLAMQTYRSPSGVLKGLSIATASRMMGGPLYAP